MIFWIVVILIAAVTIAIVVPAQAREVPSPLDLALCSWGD